MGEVGADLAAVYPLTEWQPAQPLLRNRLAPVAAAPSVGMTAALRWLAAHASKSAGVWAMTRRRMLACDSPQYSAHCPR